MKLTYKYINVSKTGYNLCRLLDDRNISAYEVAQQLGVSPTAVYKWLHGASMPTLDHIVRISQLLNVQINDIIVAL